MKQAILTQLGAARWAFDTNTEGLSHDESLAGPGNGNCLNWVGGHLVATYSRLLSSLGGEPVWTDAEARPYRRGSVPLAADEAIDFDRIRRDLGNATERVIALVAALSDDDLAKPAPFSPMNNPQETVGSLVALIAFHQAYHTGQTGLLRRLAGKPGAIR